jgi:proteasome lid subunit RPN8/RPN11
VVAIAPEHRARLRRALDAALPRECCGVLVGGEVDGVLTVRGVLPTLNTTTALGGFSIPDRELQRVERLAAQSGERIIALFHSHPGGSTELSEPDRAALAHCEWPWLVITEAAAPGDVAFDPDQIPQTCWREAVEKASRQPSSP